MRRSNITNYKDIIRLHSSGDYSNREIAKILRVSRNTISACLEKSKEKEMTIPLPKAMSNEEISALEKPRRLLKRLTRQGILTLITIRISRTVQTTRTTLTSRTKTHCLRFVVSVPWGL